MLFPIFLLSSVVALFLIIWFRTEAYVEYCRLFKLNWISHYRDYDAKKKNDVALTYHAYLRQYHNSFRTRLLTCPVCVALWLAVLLGLFVWNLAVIPMVFIGGLLLFGIVHKLLN